MENRPSLINPENMFKSLLRKFDQVLFKGALLRGYHGFQLERYLDNMNAGLGHRMVVQYRKDLGSELSALCDKYGSDKGEIKNTGHPYHWPSHTYADFYALLFAHCRQSIHRVFECGLGTNNPTLVSTMGVDGKPGASLRVWRDYFPNAHITGADIDRDILFNEDRIRTYHVDQTDSASIAALWDSVDPGHYDFMVDDGLHTFEAGVCLFENSVSRLAKGGVYVIEDVSMQNLLAFKTHFEKSQYQVEYVNLLRPEVHLGDNNLVVIRG